MSGKNARMNALEQRKRLLVAESELNRAQLVGDLDAVTAGVCSFSRRAKSFTSIASSATSLVMGIAALRSGKSAETVEAPTWLKSVIKGAGLISTVWTAFRSQRSDPDVR